MLIIRFLRVGKKNQPAFKIVITEKSRPPRSGRFVEQVGFYNPLTKEVVLKKDRIQYWISVGAQPSNSVYNLLIKEKVLEGKKIPVHKKPKGKKKEETVPTGEGKPPEEKKPAEGVVPEKTEAEKKKIEKKETATEKIEDTKLPEKENKEI